MVFLENAGSRLNSMVAGGIQLNVISLCEGPTNASKLILLLRHSGNNKIIII